MGKQGPCYHCGVTSTPLWRNGPPDKPVLCNACGSRWRTKGSLTNYTPLHARVEPGDYEDHKNLKMKSVLINKKKELNVPKRKLDDENVVTPRVTPNYSQIQWKLMDEDASNRSSSGSAISNSESCVQYCSADLSDLTGPAQSVVWDSSVPSRKRTCVNRSKQSSVEKLTQDLCAILHEQQSCLSGISEEDLLFDSETPMVSVEIGHGSVLIRHPNAIGREEESEASSLSVDNKQYRTKDIHSQPAATPVHNSTKNVNLSSPRIEKIKILCGQGIEQGQLRRDKLQHEKQHLINRSSPLCHADLKEVLNFEEFMKHLTYEEQAQLLKYLPPVDTAKLPDSLKSMFKSSQYEENLSSFQRLLAQGIFDLPPGTKADDCKALRRLVLNNLMKCKWVEHHCQLKAQEAKGETSSGPLLSGPSATVSTYLHNSKESYDNGLYILPDTQTRMKSQKGMNVKVIAEEREDVNKDEYSDSSRNLFPLPLDGHAILLDSLHSTDENSNDDLLLDMPSSTSFPQAELLIHSAPSTGSNQASTSSTSASPMHAYS